MKAKASKTIAELARINLEAAVAHLDFAIGGIEEGRKKDPAFGYALDQLTAAMAFASAARQAMEEEQSRCNHESQLETARRRLCDPAYTPLVEEVFEDLDSFMEGFRES
jgi:hypothetical protein